MNRIKILSFFIALLIAACQNNQKVDIPKDTLFQLIPSEVSGISFINKITNKKGINIFLYRNFYNGGGVGIGDINNDGLADIYMTANMEKNKLFLNQGDFKFQDITASSGTAGEHAWSTGVVMVDINADGLLDIYVCNAGNVKGDNQKNELFINNGDQTFSERAEEFGLADDGFTTHAAFFDYDGDGDLDAYILNNSFIPVNSMGYSNERMVRSDEWEVPELVKGGGDKLLRNDNGRFKDVSEEAGIYGSLIGFGMGITVSDFNQDMLPDIYVANDFYERDYLYINNGDGTFKECIKDWMAHLSLAAMGVDIADINNDGLSEIYVTEMLPEGDARLKNTTEFERYDIYILKLMDDFYHQFMANSLQLNNGNETFSEIAFYSGVAETDWSWGPIIFDMDNDGYVDIFVSNGIYHDLTDQDFIDFFASEIIQKMTISGKKAVVDSIINKMPSTPIPNYAFRNNGDLTFTNMSAEWGFDTPGFSNGTAYGDFDNDGDLDLIVNNVNQPCFVYQNKTNEKTNNHYLKVRLKGEGQNTFGIGSVVNVYYDDQIHKQEMISSRGFQSSVNHILNFGLGNVTEVDSVEVIWPNRKRQVVKNISGDQLITFNIKDAAKKEFFIKSSKTATEKLVEYDSPFDPHKENFYVDFEYEGLIAQMLSREGPAMDVGDLNNDGLDDVFIGGATNYGGQIYLQSSKGEMIIHKNDCFKQDKKFEDTAAGFFDADGDGDLDLYIGSGGNDKEDDSRLLRDRLYINNGKGAFEKADAAIPDFRYNTSVVAPYDFDQDGDMDLFVGSLSVSRIYGINPKHYLLENDGGGKFKDITEARAYKFRNMGMVTDAAWQDMDDDGLKDLVVVGQWMAPVIYQNSGRRLSPLETSLDSLSGWWNAVSITDLDNDGDMDMVLGNRGNNSCIKVSRAAPVKMFVNDFDNNGTIEQICTRYIEGKDKPIPLKREITDQLPSLLKENLRFAVYAEKSIYELFPDAIVANSILKEVITSESVLAYNEGENLYRIEALPREIQFTCVNVII
ncbi:MAG: VCBS repeat-containing protein, partial [Bacteroidales bacterium]|nr:VCBS repeat-containing protein [Bacteroidales bacterium]